MADSHLVSLLVQSGPLNVPYRIIELLHTNRHRELLSEGSEVQILLATVFKAFGNVSWIS